MNMELLQIVLWIMIPAFVIIGIGFFLLSTVGKNGKIYSVDDTFLHIYGMLHPFFPKRIRFSDMDEVVFYHSWLEPIGRGRWWTVQVRYLSDCRMRFMISDRDAPDYNPSIVKDFFGYSTTTGADLAKEHLVNVLENHGVKCMS